MARIESTGGVKQHNVNFLGCHGAVLSASRHDHKFTFRKLHGFLSTCGIFVIHAERAVNNQEQFVFRVVMMPNEFALKLYQLDVLPVQLADDLGRAMILKCGELLRHVDLVHASKVAQKLTGLRESM